MKSLITYLNEALLTNRGSKKPKTPEELRRIIIKRYKEQGPGTKNKPVDFNDIDVKGIRSFYDKNESTGIFQGIGFKYIDVSKWDVSNVINMRCTFADCGSLEELNISDWDVSKCEDFSEMFYKCIRFNSDLSNWDVSNAKNFSYMFDDCKNFGANLSMWDVRNVKNMKNMFNGCRKAIIPDWYKK